MVETSSNKLPRRAENDKPPNVKAKGPHGAFADSTACEGTGRSVASCRRKAPEPSAPTPPVGSSSKRGPERPQRQRGDLPPPISPSGPSRRKPPCSQKQRATTPPGRSAKRLGRIASFPSASSAHRADPQPRRPRPANLIPAPERGSMDATGRHGDTPHPETGVGEFPRAFSPPTWARQNSRFLAHLTHGPGSAGRTPDQNPGSSAHR